MYDKNRNKIKMEGFELYRKRMGIQTCFRMIILLCIFIVILIIWLSILTFGGHKSSNNKNIQKSSTIADSAISSSNILYTNSDGDLGIDPLVNYKLTPGLVMPFFSTTVPTGWVECDGRQLSKTEYSSLYSVIGGSFGQTTDNFLIPDLRGKFIMGSGSNLNNNGNQGGSTTYSIGNTGGEYSHTLTIGEMPSHNHKKGNYKVLADAGTRHNEYRTGTGSNPGGTWQSLYTEHTGGNGAHENRPPYIAVNYIMFTGKN